MEPVRAIFNSFAYNRYNSYMVDLCEDVLNRVWGFRSHNCDYDGDIIYGFLVIMYGDFGTSPRSGWIDANYINDITKCINELIEEYKQLQEEEDE